MAPLDNSKSGAAPTAAQARPGIGHNGGPDDEAARLFELIGPRTPTEVEPFQCGAPWTGHASQAELARLCTLQVRIELRQRAIAELIAERRLIMNRCIRRMRRNEGKN